MSMDSHFTGGVVIRGRSGALSNAQKAGAKTFDSLVKQGEAFRKKTTKRTESL
jgi:hypothetical protein